MEKRAISKLEEWFDKQTLERNRRMAIIMEELRTLVPEQLKEAVRVTQVIEKVFGGSITITAGLHHKPRCEVYGNSLDEIEDAFLELKRAWEGIINILIQRLDDEGIINIRFDAA